MILGLFGFLILISLVLIIIGLIKPDESAQAILGFFFLFLLSLVVVTGNLQYETGANITSSYQYDTSGRVNATLQSVSYDYENFADSTSHNIGYWLAVGASVGMFGVLFSLNRHRFKSWFKKNDEE